MTEELEEKLNELLGMKRAFEAAIEEREKEGISLVVERYRKEARSSRIRFWVGLVIGIAFAELGVIAIHGTGPLKFVLIGIGMLGLYIPLAAKLGLRISQSKLAILQEMKQFELRIMEMLRKGNAS